MSHAARPVRHPFSRPRVAPGVLATAALTTLAVLTACADPGPTAPATRSTAAPSLWAASRAEGSWQRFSFPIAGTRQPACVAGPLALAGEGHWQIHIVRDGRGGTHVNRLLTLDLTLTAADGRVWRSNTGPEKFNELITDGAAQVFHHAGNITFRSDDASAPVFKTHHLIHTAVDATGQERVDFEVDRFLECLGPR
jgi:hypothetical protein